MPTPDFPSADQVVVHVHHNGQNLGPFSGPQVVAMLDGGEITADAPFWFPGMSDWIPLKQQPEFAQTYRTAAPAAAPQPAAAPPPVPRTEDDRMDEIFGQLVDASWDYLDDHNFASRIDEVFFGCRDHFNLGCRLQPDRFDLGMVAITIFDLKISMTTAAPFSVWITSPVTWFPPKSWANGRG